MEDKLSAILQKLTNVEESISSAKPKWYERVFWFIEKAAIPLMIAALAYYGGLAATKLSEGQLALATSSAEDRKAEFRRTMQSKYLELFYRDITSTESREQSNAMSLLKLMDPALAADVSTFVQASPAVSPQLKAEVKAESQKIEAVAQAPTRQRGSGPLAGYKIGIYFLGTDGAAAKTANAIESHLRSQGIQNIIARYPSTSDFMEMVNPPSSLEVRFEDGLEDRQAQALIEALMKAPFGRSANAVPVGSRTPNFVSVFVPSGG